jgi:protein-S-isoprenylcysteine O-methyltransferase Ste14
VTLIFILTGLLVFGVVHSLLAGQNVKQWVCRLLGEQRYEAFYRLAYNVLAAVMLAPLGLLLVANPGAVVWQVDSPLGALLLNLLRLLGLAGLGASLLQIDLGRFAGLSQVAAYLRGERLPLPDEPLQTGGVYAMVRHPLYLFSLLVLWPAPTMTEALLAFNIGSTAYFVIGSLFEERRLLRSFGDSYRTYRDRVPWMFPSVSRFTHRILRNDG